MVSLANKSRISKKVLSVIGSFSAIECTNRNFAGRLLSDLVVLLNAYFNIQVLWDYVRLGFPSNAIKFYCVVIRWKYISQESRVAFTNKGKRHKGSS